MSKEPTPTPEDPTTAPALDDAAAEARIAQNAQNKHDHDDARVDEMEVESFPASDPPSIL